VSDALMDASGGVLPDTMACVPVADAFDSRNNVRIAPSEFLVAWLSVSVWTSWVH